MHKEVLEWEEYQEVGGNGRQGRKEKNSLRKIDWVAGEPKAALHIYGNAARHRDSTRHMKKKTSLTRE